MTLVCLSCLSGVALVSVETTSQRRDTSGLESTSAPQCWVSLRIIQEICLPIYSNTSHLLFIFEMSYIEIENSRETLFIFPIYYFTKKLDCVFKFDGLAD